MDTDICIRGAGNRGGYRHLYGRSFKQGWIQTFVLEELETEANTDICITGAVDKGGYRNLH